MRKQILSGLTAMLLATTMLAAPGVASAQPRRPDQGSYYGQGYDQHRDPDGDYRGNRGHRDNGQDDAVAAGIMGLTLGAILGASINSSHHRSYNQRGYHSYDQQGYGYDGNGYRGDGYANSYGYASQPRTCVTREQQWDDYRQDYVWVERSYPC